MENDTFMDS